MPDIKTTEPKKTTSEFLIKIRNRGHDLLLKLTGIEGVMWLTGTVALFFNILPGTDWVALSAIMAGIKTFQRTKNIDTGTGATSAETKPIIKNLGD